MNNQHHLNRTHEANATGHSVAPGSYDRKSLNPAYAEHLYGEPGSAIPGHAASGVNPKRHIPRTLENESGSGSSDIASQSTAHQDSRSFGSESTGHGISSVNPNTHSHYTHGDFTPSETATHAGPHQNTSISGSAIPGSHASSDDARNSNHLGNAGRIAPGSNVRNVGAPGTAGVAGSAIATVPEALGHNNAHPQYWNADDVPPGNNARATTHSHAGIHPSHSTAGSAIHGTRDAGTINSHTGTQHGHNGSFTRKPVAQSGLYTHPEATDASMAGHQHSAGIHPNDNIYQSDTVSDPSETSGHSGVLDSAVSGSSGHSFTHHNRGLQHSVADSTVLGSGPNAGYPDQGVSNGPGAKYHGAMHERPVELDDPSSPVNNMSHQNPNATFGQGDTMHPHVQNQSVGTSHPGHQGGQYGPGASSHAPIQEDSLHPNANNSTFQNTAHIGHGGLNETGAVHQDNVNHPSIATGTTTTTGSHTGTGTGIHNDAPPYDPTANKVPSAAAGARFGEKMKGMAAQGHGLGEFLRGNANAAIDTALGDKKNMAKHEAIARKGEEEIKRGELANKAKTGIRH